VNNPHELLAGYRDRLAQLGARSARAHEDLAHAEATATSPDGVVTVTVDPAGALRSLVLSDRSADLTRTDLAAAIMATARIAQNRAARRAVEAIAPLVGEHSEAMRLMRDRTGGPTR
jgi:DNA-binding protein YbaB